MRAARAAFVLILGAALSVEAEAAPNLVDRDVTNYWIAANPVCGYDLDRSGRAARIAANQRFARLRARFHAAGRRGEIETAITAARKALDRWCAVSRCVMPDGVVSDADRASARKAQGQAILALNRLESTQSGRGSKGST